MATVPGIVKPASSGRGANIAFWVLQVLLAAVFLMAGFSKISGAPMMVEQFEKLGLGQWFRYVTGILEVIAALILLVPRASGFGALLLVPIMLGAALAHVIAFKDNPAPPLVILALVLVVLWGRRGQIVALLQRPTSPGATA